MSDLTAARDARRPRTAWGWFVALGVVQLLLGAFAWFNVLAFTIAGVIFIGALLLVAGVFQVIHAFMDREWGSFALHLLVGILYVVGGFLLMAEPVEGSLIITLLVTAALIVGGILRIVIAIQHRPMGRVGPAAGRRRDQPAGRRDAVYDAAVVRAVGGRHADRSGAGRARRVVGAVRPGVAQQGVGAAARSRHGAPSPAMTMGPSLNPSQRRQDATEHRG